MQSVYRINSRDYKHTFEHFTTNKELFDLCDQHGDLGWPYLTDELMKRYNTDDESVDELIYAEGCNPKFPYTLLGETTLYMY